MRFKGLLQRIGMSTISGNTRVIRYFGKWSIRYMVLGLGASQKRGRVRALKIGMGDGRPAKRHQAPPLTLPHALTEG